MYKPHIGVCRWGLGQKKMHLFLGALSREALYCKSIFFFSRSFRSQRLVRAFFPLKKRGVFLEFLFLVLASQRRFALSTFFNIFF